MRRFLPAILLFISMSAMASASIAQDSGSVTETEPAVDSALRILEMQERIDADPYDGEAYTTIGILYTQEEMYEEARAAFISAIQIAPAEPMTHFNLGVCLFKMEDWSSAVQPLTSFNTLAPDDGRGYLLLGDTEKQLENMEAARGHWEGGMRTPGVDAPDKAELLRRLVASYEDNDDLRGAVAELETYEILLGRESFRDLRERRLGLYMTLAKETETSGETEEALEWLAKARDLGHAPLTAWTAAVELLLENGRSVEAEALATENLEAPAGTNAYVRARVAEKGGDLPTAARFYKEALRADPEFPSAWGYLGGVLAQMGDTQGANEALAKAAARGEGGVAAKYNLAIMKSKKGDYRGAIPLLVEVVEEDPGRKDAYRALAAAYRKEKNYTKAASVSQTIVDTFGPTGSDLYQLAYSQAKLNQHTKAAENYAMVTAMEPQNFNAIFGLGRSLSKIGRHEEAIEAFDQAVELQPENEIAMFNLAFALQKAERFEEAIDAYLEASDLKVTARSYTNIAICYQNLGDKDTADEYYEKANDLK